jgi:glycosyltransferase involved in cell wall biosynthesis
MSSPVTRVSVVIPTRNRPELVRRAVESVLAQTYRNFEIIVVIDGPDPETESALRAFNDLRLRVLALPESLGGSGARNAGVAASTGEWIAFLDDDDEWLPEKISRQIAIADASTAADPIVVTRLIARKDAGEAIWPRRRPRAGEPMSEYLFCRSTPAQGEGFIQTSTIFASRDLLMRVPFTPGLPRHQDWDWLIRAAAVNGVRVEWVWVALSIFHLDIGRPSVGRATLWDDSLDWALTCPLLTRRAFSAFVAIQIAPRIHLLRDWRRLPRLLRALLLRGAFDRKAMTIGILFLFVPTSLRTMLANHKMSRERRSPAAQQPFYQDALCRVDE